MQLGIFAKTFPGSTPDNVLGQVKAAGFSSAHYNMACSGLAAMPDAIPDAVTDDIASAASRSGVTLVGMSATWNMIHPDPVERELGFQRLDMLAKAARRVGAGLVTLCTGTRDPVDQWHAHPDNHSTEAWRDLLASMEKAVLIAERHDVFLGVEPELANVVDTAAKARRLIDEMATDRIRIVLDPANLFEIETADVRERLVDEAIDLLGDRFAMAHAKDRDAQGHFVAAGRGVIEFDHFVRRLKDAGFSGPLVTHGLAADEAADVAAFLKKTLGDAGIDH